VFLGALGLAVLTYSDGAVWSLLVFAILFSFGDGINSVTWALVGDFFGRTHFVTIRGWIGMLQSVASMPAAVFTGWIYDQTQSYTYALIPFMISYGVAGLLLWRLPHPEQPKRLGVVSAPIANVLDSASPED
jgi:MFS family permease